MLVQRVRGLLFPPPLSPLPPYKPGCLQLAFAHTLLTGPEQVKASGEMSPFCSESAWLCLAATVVLGGMFLRRAQSPGQWKRQVVCLVGLWGGACLLNLSLLCSLLLLSLLSCFLLYGSSSDQDLLPVDQKAVLVTGKWPVLLWLLGEAGHDTLCLGGMLSVFGLNIKYLE